MRPIFDRVVLARLAVAILIVVPPLLLWQGIQAGHERADRAAEIAKAVALNQADLARERIERTVTDCRAYNEARLARIATSEAIIRLAVSSSPLPLSDRDRLLL